MIDNRLHIALIMDGNRRFAVKKGESKVKGHKYGAKTFSKIVKSAKESNKIKELTFYTFSVQNFNRKQEEVDYIMNLFREFFDEHFGKIKDKNTKIKFLGRKELFPQDIQEKISKLEEETKNNTRYRVNFCFGYGGREEIVDTTKKIAQKIKSGELNPEDISEETISTCLYSNHEPDFIIRTGGDVRTSNFLLWQTSYSEWFFLKKLWPEIEFNDIEECIEQFQNRERRFGK